MPIPSPGKNRCKHSIDRNHNCNLPELNTLFELMQVVLTRRGMLQ